jgi:dTDP-L-rhamnose 4-epimerase
LDNLLAQVHPASARPTELASDTELIIADVRDASAWDKLLRCYRPETVLHLAAETGTAQSLTESTRHASVNVVGTTEMLDAFTRASVQPKHIILASSRAIYGEGAWQAASGQVFYPETRSRAQLERGEWDFVFNGAKGSPMPHRSGSVFPNPASIYGATKLAQEHILSAWGAAVKVPITIMRLQNVYGPGQSPFNPYTGIINIFHKVAFAGRPVEVYEDGHIGRDFVHIRDVAKALVAAVDRPPALRRTLDVGTGICTTIFDAATHIAELHGAPAPVISGKFRDGDVRWALADANPLLAELGIRCEIDFLGTGAKEVGDWLKLKGYMS